MYYTKYRPQTFSQISQPNHVAEALMSQLKSGKQAHAYLFVGSRGTGKTTTARILAKALNCSSLQANGDPCDSCEVCESIKVGSFMDLIEIDAASNRGIDDIRELKDKIKLAPARGNQKVYIIDEVHMLTNEAFNALLKTLEEPPAHATFILCTTEAHKIPETIKSRCQVFTFKRATKAQLIKKLSQICSEENADVSKEILVKVATLASGGFRDAETILQQVIEGSVDLDSLIASSSVEQFSEMLGFITQGDAASAIRKISKLFDSGVDLYSWTSEFLGYLRCLLFVRTGYHDEMIDVTAEQLEEMKSTLAKFSDESIVKMLEGLVEAQNAIKSSFIPQLPLEIWIFKTTQGLSTAKQTSKPVASGNPPTNLSKVKQTASKETPLHNETEAAEEADLQKISQDIVDVEIVQDQDDSEVSAIELSSDDAPVVGLDVVTENWETIISQVAKINNSIKALLKASKPIDVVGPRVCLEVSYSFHKERLESPKNRGLVETVMSEVLAVRTAIFCVVSKERPQKIGKNESGVLTDLNVSIPVSTDSGGLLSVFDGGLPL